MYRNRCFVFCFVCEITSEKCNLMEACTNSDIWRKKFRDIAYSIDFLNKIKHIILHNSVIYTRLGRIRNSFKSIFLNPGSKMLILGDDTRLVGREFQAGMTILEKKCLLFMEISFTV